MSELTDKMSLAALAEQVIRGSYTPGVEDAVLLERCDQMTARVARLEELIDDSEILCHPSSCPTWKPPHKKDDCSCGASEANVIFNETTAQSLNAIKADALEENGDKWRYGANMTTSYTGGQVANALDADAAALREGKDDRIDKVMKGEI